MAGKFSLITFLSLNPNEFTSGLGKAEGSYNKFNNNFKKGNGQLNGSFGSLVSSVGSLLPAIGAAAIATTTFNGVINTSQTAGDAWAITMAGVTGALDGLYRSIGTGDMSNLITNMIKSSTAAKELTAALDELFEKGLSSDLNNASIDLEIATAEQLRNIAKANKDFPEVIKQANLIAELELKKIGNTMQVAEATRSAFFNDIKTITGLSDSDVIGFLKTYNDGEVEKTRQLALEYQNKITKANNMIASTFSTSAGVVTIKASDASIQQQKDIINSQYSNEVKIYAATLDAYNSLNDDKITSAVNAEKKIYQTKIDYLKQTTSNEVALAKAKNKEDDFGNKVENKALEIIQKRIEKEKELQNEKVKTNGISLVGNRYQLDKNIFEKPKPKPEVIPLEFNKLSKEKSEYTYNKDGSLDQASLDLLKFNNQVTESRENFELYRNSFTDGFAAIGSSLVSSLGLASDGLEGFAGVMLEFVTRTIAMFLGQSIAGAIAGATSSGAATGPAAVFTTPAFIAEAIGSVFAAFAAIPKFETGGMIGGNSVSGDKILARLNSGEGVLTAKGVNNAGNLLNNNGGGNGGIQRIEVAFRNGSLEGYINHRNKVLANSR